MMNQFFWLTGQVFFSFLDCIGSNYIDVDYALYLPLYTFDPTSLTHQATISF
jgi:hypothetical protein